MKTFCWEFNYSLETPLATSGAQSSSNFCGHLRLHCVRISCWFRWHFIYCETLNLAFTWGRITSTVQLRNGRKENEWLKTEELADPKPSALFMCHLTIASCTQHYLSALHINLDYLFTTEAQSKFIHLDRPHFWGSYFRIVLWNFPSI